MQKNTVKGAAEKSSLSGISGWIVMAVGCIAVGWFACDLWPVAAPKQMMPPQAAPVVTVEDVAERAFNPVERFVAHAEPVQEVDLLPQIDGYITEMKFQEGSTVKAGDLLYVIDPERYTATINLRKANLAAAEAEADRAERYLKRMQAADARGITQLELDNAISGAATAKAGVLQAKANLALAEFDIKHTRIYAPISGQIGKTLAHVGDYVAPSKGALARIVQIDPIRVSFPMTDRAYVAWRQQQCAGTACQYRMRLVLPDGSLYDKEGTWQFDDNKMSAETATITMRIAFPNAERLLIPNSYVTMLSDYENPPRYPSVSQVALTDMNGGLGVWVVNAEGVVEARPVTLYGTFEGYSAIKTGLKIGEKVVKDGVQKLRPGMKVALAGEKAAPAVAPVQ